MTNQQKKGLKKRNFTACGKDLSKINYKSVRSAEGSSIRQNAYSGKYIIFNISVLFVSGAYHKSYLNIQVRIYKILIYSCQLNCYVIEY